MSNPKISVIMPCFNGERYLTQALESLRWQTYPHWECILIDDGSIDRSAEIFKTYKDQDSRFRYYFQTNQGPAAARNFGLEVAEGDFIQFLDADDVILPERFHFCLEQFDKSPKADVVYSDYVCYSAEDGFIQALPSRIPFTDTVRSFMFQMDINFVILIHSFLFRRKVFETKKFETNLHSHGEDTECWIRIALEGARFVYLDNVLSVYRYSQDSLAQKGINLFSAKLKTIEQYRTHPKSIEYYEDYARTVQHFRERLAIAYIMEKQFKNGFRELKTLWKSASTVSRMKILGWLILMSVFSKKSVLRFRTLLLLGYGKLRGSNAIHRRWIPPSYLISFLSYEK